MAATTLPDGNVKITHGLSFVTTTRTKRGRTIKYSSFDVPAESYGDGWITGTLAAGELLTALRHERFDLLRTLCEAAAVSGDDKRRGAAVGFLRTIEQMLYFAAEHANHEGYVARKIVELRAMGERAERAEQAEKRAFAERMEAGKRAKAQRQTEASHG